MKCSLKYWLIPLALGIVALWQNLSGPVYAVGAAMDGFVLGMCFCRFLLDEDLKQKPSVREGK